MIDVKEIFTPEGSGIKIMDLIVFVNHDPNFKSFRNGFDVFLGDYSRKVNYLL